MTHVEADGEHVAVQRVEVAEKILREGAGFVRPQTFAPPIADKQVFEGDLDPVFTGVGLQLFVIRDVVGEGVLPLLLPRGKFFRTGNSGPETL